MKPIEITVNFNNKCCRIPAIGSIFAGLKVLENNGIVKVKKYNMSSNFASSEFYPNRYIIELTADGKILAYDISDGYQDFDFPQTFNDQLERIDFYFKSSYDPDFALKLNNKEKFQNLAMSFGCSYPGSYFEKAKIKNAISEKSFKEAAYISLKASQIQAENDYRKLESNKHYDCYNLLFWTRLWEYGHLTAEHIMKAYPTLTHTQAEEKCDRQIEMLRQTNSERIKTVRILREAFGDKFVGGLSDNETSRKEAPDLITSDPRVVTRQGYLDSLKQNYIHILSKGVHGCVGARYGETFAAGRALITDPFVYEPAGGLKEGENYLRYTSPEEVLSCATALINDVDTVHRMEDNNFRYYNEFVRPDVRMLNTLKVAFPDRF
ncbi:MAG: hypothetical protein IJA87_10220 [Clostridia bacterium]|nr:hypothetical protein [Clostridia bacterium]